MLLRDAFRKLFPMLETDDIPDREGFIDGGAHFLLTTREEKRRYVVGRILEGLGDTTVGNGSQRNRSERFYAMEQIMRSDVSPEDKEVYWGMIDSESAEYLRPLVERGLGVVPASSLWRRFDIENEDEDGAGKDGRIWEKYCSGFFKDHSLNIVFPIHKVIRFLERILPPTVPQEVNEAIFRDLKTVRLACWSNVAVLNPDVGFSNASYGWSPMRLAEMIAATGEEALSDLRFRFMGELFLHFEREDVVLIGGSDDDHTGWDGGWRSASRSDDMAGGGEMECVREAATAGVERGTFPSWMSQFVRGQRTQWGVQPKGKRMLTLCGTNHRSARVTVDPVYGHWTAQNYDSGLSRYFDGVTRTRWWFLDSTPPSRASVPDVVDLKITNKCPFACAYCYQSSTMQGVHATKESIFEVLDVLGDWGAFELAIGGGEPTLHPDLYEILTRAMAQGLVPNITTRNRRWLTDKKNAPWILNAIGGVGFSVDTPEEIDSLVLQLAEAHEAERMASYCPKDGLLPLYDEESLEYFAKVFGWLDAWGVSHGEMEDIGMIGYDRGCCRIAYRITIHVVMGVQSWAETAAIINNALGNELSVLLLDYKQTGFASQTAPHDYSEVVGYICAKLKDESRRYGAPKISIDTPLAGRFHQQLEDAGFATQSYDTEDGRFSLYIDATTGTAGPSSYCDKAKMRPYTAVGDESLAYRLHGIFNSEPVNPKNASLLAQEEDAIF